jgi:hypothetical protein
MATIIEGHDNVGRTKPHIMGGLGSTFYSNGKSEKEKILHWIYRWLAKLIFNLH